MIHGRTAPNNPPGLFIFGIAWFLPYCVHTLWVSGALTVSNVIAPDSVGSLVEWIWRQAAAYSSVLTLLSQLLIGCLLIAGSRTVSWRALGFRRTSGIWFFVAIVGLILSQLVTGLLQATFHPAGLETGPWESGDNRPAGHSISYLLTALLFIVPMTAVIEEVAFRGVLYGWLRTRIGPAAGIVVSSFIFSLFHLYIVNPGGLLGIGATVQIMFGGIVLAFLYEKSGSLWPGIYLHGVNNAVAVF